MPQSKWLRNGAVPIVVKILFFPVGLLLWGLEEISGGGWWYRRQRRRMVEERPPLTADEFLKAVNAAAADARLWLAVRHAMAERIGVPDEAVYPHDRLADLWRMHWIGLDLLDFLFRLERILGKKIMRASFDKYLAPRRQLHQGEFYHFAEAVVRGLEEHP